MITRVLVANRGEIARRVFASCRRLGIETVAVHSDADAGLPFVAEADVAVRLPGNAPVRDLPPWRSDHRGRQADRARTRSTPATASCPRTPTSPATVEAAGLIWIGPAPESIDAMGSKIEAKAAMKATIHAP